MSAYVKVAATFRVLLMWIAEVLSSCVAGIRKNCRKIRKSCHKGDLKAALSEIVSGIRANWKGYLFFLLFGMLLMVIFVRAVNKDAALDTVSSAPIEIHEETETELAAKTEALAEQSAADAEEQLREDEAEAMARVLYGTARKCSTDAQKAICWLIINRCESSIYPDTVAGVCSQPYQWMGYSDDNPVIENLYEVAREVVDAWHDGGRRMIGTDFLYMTWEGSTVSLRTTFTENSSTRYWHG